MKRRGKSRPGAVGLSERRAKGRSQRIRHPQAQELSNTQQRLGGKASHRGPVHHHRGGKVHTRVVQQHQVGEPWGQTDSVQVNGALAHLKRHKDWSCGIHGRTLRQIVKGVKRRSNSGPLASWEQSEAIFPETTKQPSKLEK